MSKKRPFASATIIALLVVALLVFFFVTTQPATTNPIGLVWGLGEEVENYPISELSTSFTSWNMTTKLQEPGFNLDPGNESLLVLVNFTIRNTTNRTINLFDQPLLAGLATRQIPSLCFEGQTKRGEYISGSLEDNDVADSWLNHLRPDELVLSSGLMDANETAEGLLIYALPKGFGASGLGITYSTDLEIFVELVNPNPENSLE